MPGFKKNVSGQKWLVFAFDRTDNTPKTGDAANITAKIRKDSAAAAGTNDTNPTEIEDGYYEFDLTQAETNADVLDLLPESSTADIQVVACPARVFTVPPYFSVMAIDANGRTDVGKLGGDAQSAADLKDFADTGYDPATHKVETVKTADTTTTNTDMRGTDSAYTGTPPTAAAVADAVWDETQSGHTTAGTFGKYIDAQISAIENPAGSGSTSCTITVQDAGASPLDGAAVWVSTDAAGSNVIAGTQYTNASGQATFLLDDGSYYAWKQLSGYNFTNPEPFTVS